MNYMKKYQIGDIVTGKVTGFEKYGIFLSFDDGYTGLIHISELSENFVKDVKEYASIDDLIPCVVIDVDEEDKHVKCSIKNTDFSKEKDEQIDHGFSPLKKQLPSWVAEKLDEMSKNEPSTNKNA